MKRALLFSISYSLAAAAAGQDIRINPNAGTTSAVFLQEPADARPVAMGEAFTAVSGDAVGLLWNPASIAAIRTDVFSGSYNDSFQSIQEESGIYAHPLARDRSGNDRSLALHVLTLVPPSQDRRSGLNEGDPFNPISNPDGTFGAYNVAAGVSYAQTFGPRWSAGATLQLIRESIDVYSANTVGINLGVQRKLDLPGLALGASLLNFGPPNKFVSTSYPLPLTLRLGAAYKPFERSGHPDRLLATFDFSVPNNDYVWLSAGADYTPIRAFSLRAGYTYRWYGDPLGGASGIRVGAGLRFHDIRFDYAFAPFGDLGNEHRISLAIPWGRAPEPEKPAFEPVPAMPAASAPGLRLPAAIEAPPLASGAVLPSAANVSTAAYSVSTRLVGVTPKGAVFAGTVAALRPDSSLREATFRTPPQAAAGFAFDSSESTAAVPAGVLPSSFTALRMLHFELSPPVAVRTVVIDLQLDAGWLKARGVAPEKVALFEVEDGKGAPQMLVLKEADEARAAYEAMTDSLSGLFVLAVENAGTAPPAAPVSVSTASAAGAPPPPALVAPSTAPAAGKP